MPELPEVETVKNGITPAMQGATIQEIVVRERRFRKPIPAELESLAKNQQIIAIRRRAKYLLIDLANQQTIIIHLGMSGNLTLQTPDSPLLKHDHVIFKFTDSQGNIGEARLNDPRRFGLVDIIASEQVNQLLYIKSLGVEPLSDEFTGEYLYKQLKKRSIPIKVAVMDSKLVVGVGNIYASEALFRAKICPTNVANQVSLSRYNTLVSTIKEVLNDAILAGGSTLKDHLQSDGSIGHFQYNFKVYGRENLACETCKNDILKVILAQRSSFYCPVCQR